MSIEVHVRFRPGGSCPVWSSAETVLYSTSNPHTRYVYNKVHPFSSSNRTIFQGLEAMVHAGFDGKNVTFMAYGQTGSGKTHSMIGIDEDPGIVPRTAKLLLELKRLHPETQLQAYYTEIYNESVKDLLEPLRGELALHDAPDGGVTFDKRTIHVESYDDFLQLQLVAERNRKYGVTNLNDHSSRSHIILTFEVLRENKGMRSVINLVDLAGSESAFRANTEGVSLREGGFINRSLLTLGNVVDAIVDRRSYIPYRDSKLTRILRTCLGGSGITFILCCINPSAENFDQTVATLRFTQRAMKIKNDPVVVLNMPPLFTHQFSDSASHLIEGMQESAEAEYQRGLRDAYMYTHSTTSSVVSNFQSQVADSMHALANMQRQLVANDHAKGIDRVGRLHSQLTALQRQKQKNQEITDGERKRQREVSADIAERRRCIEQLEGDLAERSSAADTQLACWEYDLHEAHQKQLSEAAILCRSEAARRARIHYEWGVCIERVTCAWVPRMLDVLSAATARLGAGTTLPESASPPTLHDMRLRLQKARAELADLTVAHEMVQEDLRGGGGPHSSHRTGLRTTNGEAEEGGADSDSDVALAADFQDIPTEEIPALVDRLEREERTLLAQARREARRESIRQVRDSLRTSRSPQSTTVTRSRTPQPLVASGSATDADSQPSSRYGGPTAPFGVGRRASAPSDTYAADVRNALAVLDSIKRQLAPSFSTAVSGAAAGRKVSARGNSLKSRSRTPLERVKKASATPSPALDDEEDNRTFLEMYYRGTGGGAKPPRPEKENAVSRSHRPHLHKTRQQVPLNTGQLVTEDDDIFTVTEDPMTPPSRVAAHLGGHWDKGSHQPRQNVERTLYTVPANSQTPVHDGGERRNYPEHR